MGRIILIPAPSLYFSLCKTTAMGIHLFTFILRPACVQHWLYIELIPMDWK